MNKQIKITETRKTIINFNLKGLEKQVARGIFRGFLAMLLILVAIFHLASGNYWGVAFDFVLIWANLYL